MNYLYGIAADTISISASHVGAAKNWIIKYIVFAYNLREFKRINDTQIKIHYDCCLDIVVSQQSLH